MLKKAICALYFTGEIKNPFYLMILPDCTLRTLQKIIILAERFPDKEEDSIIIFKGQEQKWLKKEIIGKKRCNLGNLI